MLIWREMTTSDVESVLRVADVVHPDLPEGVQVFAERAKLFPRGCLVLVEGDEICGYAISHPIRRGQPPALDSILGEVAADADQYYIHDLAILPKLRGHGHASEGITKLLAVANEYPTTSLISVYGTAPFWARFGFVLGPVDQAISGKLCEYGDDATFLVRYNEHSS